MPEHQEQPARVMGFDVAAAARLDEAFNFARAKLDFIRIAASSASPLPACALAFLAVSPGPVMAGASDTAPAQSAL
jgi:hypothetical protein